MSMVKQDLAYLSTDDSCSGGEILALNILFRVSRSKFDHGHNSRCELFSSAKSILSNGIWTFSGIWIRRPCLEHVATRLVKMSEMCSYHQVA